MQNETSSSTSHDESTLSRFWQRATRRLSRQINFGWWLSKWLPLAAGIGLVSMVVILYVRWRTGEATAWVWGGIAFSIALAGLVGWWRSRSRFESEAASRVRLEEAFGLHARLTAANAGVGTWPTIPSAKDSRWPVLWRWQRPIAVVAFITAMLSLSAWVPIARAVAVRTYTIEKPTDARVVEQWLEELEEEEIISEKSIEEIERKIKELTERPAEEWYEHASLEAAGTLREQTEASMKELVENAVAAEQAAAALQSMQNSLPNALREAFAKELADAITALEQGDLRLDGDMAKLLSELKAIDPKQLTPKQCQGLAKRLSENRESLCKALGKCKGFNLSECLGIKPGSKPGSKLGQNPGAGVGGISRGRGDAELSFGDENDLDTSRVERIEQEIDMERAAPGELMTVMDGEHDVDESAYTGARLGGDVANEGDGGTAVHSNVLLPSEQATLKRFFE